MTRAQNVTLHQDTREHNEQQHEATRELIRAELAAYLGLKETHAIPALQEELKRAKAAEKEQKEQKAAVRREAAEAKAAAKAAAKAKQRGVVGEGTKKRRRCALQTSFAKGAAEVEEQPERYEGLTANQWHALYLAGALEADRELYDGLSEHQWWVLYQAGALD